MNYQIVSKSGEAKGVSWPIGDAPLVVGRSTACDVVLHDRMVSRRHCAISYTDGQLKLEDLSSSNACLVNGTPTSKCSLRIGDVLSIGQSTFFVTRGSYEQEPAGPFDSEVRTATLADSDFEYLSGVLDESDLGPHIRTVRDLHGLYMLSTSLGKSKSLLDATRRLHAFVEESFSPFTALVYLAAHDTDSVALSAGGESGDIGNESLVKHAIAQGTPFLKQPASDTESDPVMMVAPIVRDRNLGALAVVGAPTNALDMLDLRFLVAISRTAAPYLRLLSDYEEMEDECDVLRKQSSDDPILVGTSRAMEQLRGTIRRIAGSELNVIILGETGTGKESVARLLHLHSPRAHGPYVVVNCAAIPPDLFESEFFGHEKGSFTGADHRRVGLLEEADGGTLFLDEVGDLNPTNQARLLRAVENGTFRTVGGTDDCHVDVRFLSATNLDIHPNSNDGSFRQDLYHRLCGFEIEIPALRERPSDIPVLAEHFLRLGLLRANRGSLSMAPEAMDYLQMKSWRGNARELKNLVDRAIVLARGKYITLDDIHQCVGGRRDERSGEAPKSLAELEKHHIEEVLRRCAGDTDKAVGILEISRATLYRRIKEYNIKL
jgi:DNA-binding NtrC family response regulator